ncbi:glycosyltransferase family 92 protein F13G3.3-like [Discoglossus pictus]
MVQEKGKANSNWRLCKTFKLKAYLIALCFASVILTSICFHLLKRYTKNGISFYAARETITPLRDNRTVIISAYYDKREGYNVRVIAILHDDEVKELYCWFHCKNEEHYIPVRAKFDVHSSDRFGFPFVTTDLLCKEPYFCDPRYVSIHWTTTGNQLQIPVFEIKNHEPQEISANFTVCISTMFGNHNNILQFVQAMEMFKLLGAQRVVIYKNSCSVALGKVLEYYVNEGLVQIIPWPIDKYLQTSESWHYNMDTKNQIGYFGQLAALNDCLYRNMYTSKYVTFNDIDEIILPKKHKDWKEMMTELEKQHQNIAVYLIENHYFPTQVKDSTYNMTFPISVPGVNILQHIYYEPEQKNVYNNHKMIVNPRQIIQVSIHFTLKEYGQRLEVANDVVGLHHCRSAKQPDLPFTSLIRDTTIWNFNVSLITNVNKVLKNLFY